MALSGEALDSDMERFVSISGAPRRSIILMGDVLAPSDSRM
jgi:hypothetical protein